MSDFEGQHDSNEAICPYCKYSYQVESEDYLEDVRPEECSGCGKKYYLSQSFSVDHTTEPDCELNGEPHQWKAESLGGGQEHPFCSVCGKCQPHQRGL